MYQQFALDHACEIRSIHEVARGKSCHCICPACAEPLIAKQGDIKVWHFAHQSEQACAYAGETALHLAAKKIIEVRKAVRCPALPEAPLTVPELTELALVEPEKDCGNFRPDLYCVTPVGEPLLVEICVTHAVDSTKLEKLMQFGVAAMEIVVDPSLRENWSWENLQSALFDPATPKTWLFHPDEISLAASDDQAPDAALKKQDPLDAPQSVRLSYLGLPIKLTQYDWGVSLWHPYTETKFEAVRDLCWRLGGRRQKKYQNYGFPGAQMPLLLASLLELGFQHR